MPLKQKTTATWQNCFKKQSNFAMCQTLNKAASRQLKACLILDSFFL
jgi:hypothetical protein